MSDNVPKTQDKPKEFEQNLIFCEIDQKNNQIRLNIDSSRLPESIKTKNEAVEYINKKLFGSANSIVASEILKRGAGALPRSINEDEKHNIVLSSSQEMQPRDVVESRLCVKETALYTTAMHYMKRAEMSLDSQAMGSSLWYETYMKYAIKLLRLHNETVETLSKYRRQGEQRVVVQHQYVNIEKGGQAVVGNFNAKGGN